MAFIVVKKKKKMITQFFEMNTAMVASGIIIIYFTLLSAFVMVGYLMEVVSLDYVIAA